MMNPRHSRRLRCLSLSLSLAVAAAVAFVACSDDGAGNADPPTSVEAATTTVTPAAAETTAPANTVPAVTVATVAPDTTVPVAAAPTTAAPTTVAPPQTAVVGAETAETATSVAAADAPLDPLDDLDEDGTFDERCGTADLGGGLIVQTLCNTALTPTPEGGVVPTPQSLLSLPTPSRWEDLADVDATVRVTTAADGRRIVIYVLGSDTLFDSGKSAIRSTAQPPLAAIVASIAARFPSAPIQVRGAADSVGSAAANQNLSEQRAGAVVAALAGLGIDTARMTSIGLGSNVPVALETNPDGSVSDIGRQVNRRVEIVVG